MKLKVISDDHTGIWLVAEDNDKLYLHNYNYDKKQLISDIDKLLNMKNAIDSFNGNETKYFSEFDSFNKLVAHLSKGIGLVIAELNRNGDLITKPFFWQLISRRY